MVRLVILYKLKQWYDLVTDPPKLPQDPIDFIFMDAVEEQNSLGWNNFMKGRMSKQWGEAQ
eukprot:12420517-Ditylum_brightwellii.AAC.2